jgi:hypothetical protein
VAAGLEEGAGQLRVPAAAIADAAGDADQQVGTETAKGWHAIHLSGRVFHRDDTEGNFSLSDVATTT